VLLEGLGKLKKKIHLIGTRTHDLPACNIVPQPTTPPGAPDVFSNDMLLMYNMAQQITRIFSRDT
jgi:hypothetical protein